MGDIPHHIRERFPDKQDIIASRMAEDAEFCVLCEDYGACIKAYRYWMRSREPEAGARVKEYRDLIQALESEVEEALLGPQCQRLD
jgi:hypothetical protein